MNSTNLGKPVVDGGDELRKKITKLVTDMTVAQILSEEFLIDYLIELTEAREQEAERRGELRGRANEHHVISGMLSNEELAKLDPSTVKRLKQRQQELSRLRYPTQSEEGNSLILKKEDSKAGGGTMRQLLKELRTGGYKLIRRESGHDLILQTYHTKSGASIQVGISGRGDATHVNGIEMSNFQAWRIKRAMQKGAALRGTPTTKEDK